jgi:hypothetical protein
LQALNLLSHCEDTTGQRFQLLARVLFLALGVLNGPETHCDVALHRCHGALQAIDHRHDVVLALLEPSQSSQDRIGIVANLGKLLVWPGN